MFIAAAFSIATLGAVKSHASLDLLAKKGVSFRLAPGHTGPPQRMLHSELAGTLQDAFALRAGDAARVIPGGASTAATRSDALAALVRLLQYRYGIPMLTAKASTAVLTAAGIKKVAPAIAREVATAIRYGIAPNAHVDGTWLNAGLSQTDLATLLTNADLSFHFLKLRCPQTFHPGSSLLARFTVSASKEPSINDLCTANAVLESHGIVVLDSGTVDDIATYTGRRIPLATATTVVRALKKGSSAGPPSSLVLQPQYTAIHIGAGSVPHVFVALGASTPDAKKSAEAALEKWMMHEGVAPDGTDPLSQLSVCNVATGGPASNGSLLSSWTCYVELSIAVQMPVFQAASCAQAGGVDCSSALQTFTLAADLLRWDENDPGGDAYFLAARWQDPPGSCDSPPSSGLISSYTCGPYVTSRAISMPVPTTDTDTNPYFTEINSNGEVAPIPSDWPTPVPNFGLVAPTNTVPLTLLTYLPTSSTGNYSNSIGGSDSVSAGLNAGVSGSSPAPSANANVSANETWSYSQTWSAQDIRVQDDSANFPGAASWIETFLPPYNGVQDAIRGFDGTSEAAVFEVPENSPPVNLGVYGQVRVATVSGGQNVFEIGSGWSSELDGALAVGMTFIASPPIFDACTLPAPALLFVSNGFVCDNPQAASSSADTSSAPEIAVPLESAGNSTVPIYINSFEAQYGATMQWTVATQQPANIVASSYDDKKCLTPAECISGIGTPNYPATLPGQSSLIQYSSGGGAGPAGSGQNDADGGPIAFNAEVLGVSAVSPSSGPITGDTALTIKGGGFNGALAVKFGNTMLSPCGNAGAPCFTLDSSYPDTELHLVTPAVQSAQNVEVTVEGADAFWSTPTSALPTTSSSDQFAYVAPTPTPAPQYVPSVSGVRRLNGDIAIIGAHFSTATMVHFGNFEIFRCKRPPGPVPIVGQSPKPPLFPCFDIAADSEIIAFPSKYWHGTVSVTVTDGVGTSAVSTADRYTFPP